MEPVRVVRQARLHPDCAIQGLKSLPISPKVMIGETNVGVSFTVVWRDFECSRVRTQSLFLSIKFCQTISRLHKSECSLRLYGDYFVEDFKSLCILLVFAFAAHNEQPPADFHSRQQIFHAASAPKRSNQTSLKLARPGNDGRIIGEKLEAL